MAEYKFSDTGETPVYNYGVLRTPGVKTSSKPGAGAVPNLFADSLARDIIGGQVAEGFKATVGAPLKAKTATPGVYEVSTDTTDYADVSGLLLHAVDAFDGARQINIVKGGTVNTKVGALAALDATKLGALAKALVGKYDPVLNTIKF